jgi:translation initiation factor 3 subunit K
MPDFNLSLALLSEMRHYESASAHVKDPDPLPTLLPHLIALSSLLEQCRFREFWTLYKSSDLEPLRENYTVECKGFDSNVRDVVVRTVKSTFAKISEERLSSYLDLAGMVLQQPRQRFLIFLYRAGPPGFRWCGRLGRERRGSFDTFQPR